MTDDNRSFNNLFSGLSHVLVVLQKEKNSHPTDFTCRRKHLNRRQWEFFDTIKLLRRNLLMRAIANTPHSPCLQENVGLRPPDYPHERGSATFSIISISQTYIIVNPIGASVGKFMYRKESNMNTEELYKQYAQLLRGAPVDYGYRIAPKSPKHKALLTAFFRQKS